MAVSLNDIIRVAVRMSGPDGQDIINVWHLLVSTLSGGDNDDVLADIATIVQTIYDHVKPAITGNQSDRDISAQNLNNSELLGTTSWDASWQGTATGDELPATVSPFSLFRTGLSRRLGKKYWGVTTEAVQTDGAITLSAAQTGLANAIAAVIGGFTGGTTSNVYVVGTYNENLTPAFVPFNEAVYRGNLRQQRRRYPGVGS